MLRIILNGCNGKMGQAITACVNSREDCEIVAGVDKEPIMLSRYPVFTDPHDITCEADVLIDFSHPSALKNVLSFCVSRKVPAVIATTGFSDEQIEEIKNTSNQIPVFFSFNMSLGVNLLVELCKKAASVLGNDFDIEIVEAHHNQKIDAPSGTALMLANAINQVLNNEYIYKYDRHSQRKKRSKKEIGIHAVRGGTIVGEHQVIFAGRDEIITLSHSARSKEIFAAGAISAALFLFNKPSGLYNMLDLVKST